jgi:hypothetical protein
MYSCVREPKNTEIGKLAQEKAAQKKEINQ